ncbi:hypothetical protein [Streptomyces herbicida]|uniref:hypothetical protein n=1 Tax=Streptomyces herbicida TaxID=3065675 RepID=UPI00292DDFBB|nr:hypothetical protein [Streptomyces sp. NEAU-HV9]
MPSPAALRQRSRTLVIAAAAVPLTLAVLAHSSLSHARPNPGAAGALEEQGRHYGGEHGVRQFLDPVDDYASTVCIRITLRGRYLRLLVIRIRPQTTACRILLP